MVGIFKHISISLESKDQFICLKDTHGFSVNIIYACISALEDEIILRNPVLVWKSKIPSSIQVSCWKLIQMCLPTRPHLDRLGVLEGRHNNVCPLCFAGEKEELHLFLGCSISSLVWLKVCSWIDISLIPHNNSIPMYFEIFC